MASAVKIAAEQVTGNDLVEIYRRYCKVYNLNVQEKDERFLKTKGMEGIRKGQGFSYVPRVGYKFYAQNLSGGVFFDGYDPDTTKWESRRRQLRNEVNDYLSNRAARSA